MVTNRIGSGVKDAQDIHRLIREAILCKKTFFSLSEIKKEVTTLLRGSTFFVCEDELAERIVSVLDICCRDHLLARRINVYWIL